MTTYAVHTRLSPLALTRGRRGAVCTRVSSPMWAWQGLRSRARTQPLEDPHHVRRKGYLRRAHPPLPPSLRAEKHNEHPRRRVSSVFTRVSTRCWPCLCVIFSNEHNAQEEPTLITIRAQLLTP